MLPDPSSTSRPPRPNSIEVKRNYPGEEAIYASRNVRSPQDNNVYRSVGSIIASSSSFSSSLLPPPLLFTVYPNEVILRCWLS